MKRPIAFIAAAALAFMCLAPAPAGAGAKETEKINDSVTALKEIMTIPEKSIPPALLEDSYGIAVIPGVIKAGFIVGGRHGRGVLSVRQGGGSWSPPSFVTLTGGSIGWQIGAQSIDVILVFKSGRSVDNLVKGKFTLGADAAVAAGPVGRQAEAATDVELKAEIYSYSRSRGLFAGISLEGAVLQIADKSNAAFYGREVSAEEVFSGSAGSPRSATRFRDALEGYAP